jgi:signal transduction histidine kinase
MRSFRVQTVAVLLAVLVVIWSAAMLEIDRSQTAQEHLAQATTLFEAQAFARNTVSTIQRVNELLLDLRGNWLEHPDEFSSLITARQPHMADLTFQVTVIGADGYVLFSNLQRQKDRIFLGDREHFKVHLERGGDRLFISKPVLGKISHRWSIQFTRPILDHDALVGVLVISVQPDALAHFNAELGLGEGSVSAIATNDGHLLARQPSRDDFFGRQLTGYPFDDPNAANSGFFRRVAQTDGVERIYGYQKIPEYGLIVTVGHRVADVLALEFQQRTTILVTALEATAILLAAFGLLWRGQNQRKLAEDEVLASQAMLQSSIDAIGEAFAIYDQKDRLAYFNERYRQLYAKSAPVIERGRSFEEIIRYGVAHGQYRHALGREEEWIRERIEAHAGEHSDQLQQLEDGSWLRVRERRTPEGNVVGFRIDITELVEARRAAEAARRAAEAASRAKTEFLSNMSHELRTPLNGIIGMSEVLARSSLDTHQHEMLGYLNTCSERLRTLVADLLDYAALESGTLDLKSHEFSARSLVDDLMREIRPRVEAKGLALSLDLAADLPAVVRGDPYRLRQVLSHLLDNAIKFTDTGGITLVGSAGQPDQAGMVQLRFSVRDTGIGIAGEDRDMIFQPFTQKDGSSTRRHGGTGLGLSLASGIVAQMGGEISVESVPGYGSVFTFTANVAL